MWHRGRFRTPPPWWPANEPWPPTGQSQVWRRGRARFMRRLALVFAVMLVLIAAGAIALLSTLIGGRGGAAAHPGKVIVPVGGPGASVVAVDARDGATVWKAGDQPARRLNRRTTWSAPVSATSPTG